MRYLCHLVISNAVISVINQFSLNWNVRICMLVEYFGCSKSIPGQIVCSASLMASLRSKTKYPPDVARVGAWNSLPGKVKTDRMACVAAKWVALDPCRKKDDSSNLGANIFRESRYDYVLEDLPSKLDDKTYDRSGKFIRLLS